MTVADGVNHVLRAAIVLSKELGGNSVCCTVASRVVHDNSVHHLIGCVQCLVRSIAVLR